MLFVLIGDSEVGYQKSCFNFSSKIYIDRTAIKLLVNWQKYSDYF